jgi:putative PEP-CTERM system histidine kinase
MIQWIEAAALFLGLASACILALFPRLGNWSWQLIFLILPASLSAGVQVSGEKLFGLAQYDCLKISFALVIFTAAGGFIVIGNLNKTAKRIHIFIALAISLLLIAGLFIIRWPYCEALQLQTTRYAVLGPLGYSSAIFLLILSVIALSKIEQILRNTGEIVRWELKFFFLGIGALYTAIIYLASRVLLFPPQEGLLSAHPVRLFHFIFLISCGLIAISWMRSSGKTRITISHSAVYSSITLLVIGTYLIASSLIARWTSQWGDLGLPTEALIFFLSAVTLTSILLGTGFRHRTRAWIRRNIFAGSYDYRRFWLEATERVRSIDPPKSTASALSDIVHEALGAIDISVWIRRWDPARLQLLSSLGNISDPPDQEVYGVVEQLLNIDEPLSVHDLDKMQDVAIVKDFSERTHTSLLVPLLSSNRIVGIITVGSDRSGRPYDWEAREFLRALAGHAAGEFHKSDLLSTLVAAKEDEAFRAFSTFLLHDLKNFASTLSYIAQNAPRHQHNPEFQKDAFQSVYDTAEKMKRLCNSLRSFSSNLAANKKILNLNQIAQSAADNLLTGVSRNLKIEFCDQPKIMADPEEIGRVIQNLLVNAVEATSENGGIIVRTSKLGDHVELCVEDNGKGMSREFREKELFQPFHTTKTGGLGIGLFHSKKIIDAHRGAITIDSEAGKGTKVTLRFPAAQEEQELP